MAGVKPVEYIKDSSTTGFAVAGDQKPITDNNANTIKKDVDQGNTQKLDSGQTKYLEGKVDEDTIDYSNDEMKNVGKNQIDTKDTESSDAGGAILDTAASAGTTVAAAASATLGKTFLSAALKNSATSKIPFAAVLAGGVDLAIGALAIVAANSFDDQLGSRTNYRDTSGDTNQTIQNYFDLMTSDMDTMVEDAQKYKELSDTKLTGDVDRITQIGALQAQLSVYESQGNQEKVAELQAQLDELTQEGEQDPTGAMLGDLEKGLETYSGNSAEASGVAESGDAVSEFLKQGTTMGVLATVNSALLLATGIIMAVNHTISATKAALKVPGIWSKFAAIAIGIAGCVMMVAGNAMVVAAAIKMGNKAKDEFQCADAGSEMQDNVNNLRSNIEQQAGFTESTGAEYTTITTENAETTQKVQEGVDKANKNNPTQPAGSNPTTPTNGNGNGEKPEEPTAPEGAAA